MKIGFVSGFDPTDINCWSGTLYYIFKSLQKSNEIKWVGKNAIESAYRLHFFKYGNRSIFTPELYANYIGYYVDRFENINSFDLLLVKDCYLISNIRCLTPMIYIGDATFHQISPIYNLSMKQGYLIYNNVEQEGLSKMHRIILSSYWAKEGTVKAYKISPNIIDVIEFGANINKGISKKQLLLKPPIDKICNLLFIGRSSKEKGLFKAYNAYNILKNRGVECSFTIIGCTAEYIDNTDPNVNVYFLDKSKSSDRSTFKEILLKSHVHILPTLFDCFGIAFCEASAYGIPSIAPKVGGVEQVIVNSKNGFLLNANSTAEAYAERIEFLCKNKEEYKRMQEGSIYEYKTRLNWNIWLAKIQVILEKTLKFKDSNNYENFFIPTFFFGKKGNTLNNLSKFIEYQTIHIDEINWTILCSIVKKSMKSGDDIILITKGEFTFSKHYSKKILYDTIISSSSNGVEVLLGNVDNNAICWHVTENRDMILDFLSTNFIIIFRSCFSKIIKYSHKSGTIESSIRQITKNINVFNPHIVI